MRLILGFLLTLKALGSTTSPDEKQQESTPTRLRSRSSSDAPNMGRTPSMTEMAAIMAWVATYGFDRPQTPVTADFVSQFSDNSGGMAQSWQYIGQTVGDSPQSPHKSKLVKFRFSHSPYPDEPDQKDPTNEIFSWLEDSFVEEPAVLECLALIKKMAFSDESVTELIGCMDLVDERMFGGFLPPPLTIRIQQLSGNLIETRHVDMQMLQTRWLETSLRVRTEICDYLINRSRLNLGLFKLPTDGHSIFNEVSVINFITTLSTAEDETWIAKGSRDWLQYSLDYFVPYGSGIFWSVSKIQEHVVRYVTDVATALDLEIDAKHFEATMSLVRLLTNPEFKLLSTLPRTDFNPNPDSFLKDHFAPRVDMAAADISRLIQALRPVWPAADPEHKPLCAVDCLLLRWLGMSRYPIVQAMSIDEGHTDTVQKHKLLPLVGEHLRKSYGACLDRTKHVDMTSLPMMVYHLISERIAMFDYVALLPLLRFYMENFEWRVLDRAAKLRAAISISPPGWWVRLRSGTVTLGALLPDLEVDNALLAEVLSTPIGPEFMPKMAALAASGWSEDVQSEAVQTVTLMARMIAQSIEYSGDFVTTNRWVFVLSQYVGEYNTLMAIEDPRSREDESRRLIARINGVARVAHRHAQVVESAAAAEAELFSAEQAINMSNWGSECNTYITSRVGGDAALVASLLDRMVRNLRLKFS